MKATIRKAKYVSDGIKFTQYKIWVDKLYADGRGMVEYPCAEVYRASTEPVSPVGILQCLWLKLNQEFGEGWVNLDKFIATAIKANWWTGSVGYSIDPEANWFSLD